MPKMVPVRAETMKAIMTDSGETMALIEVKLEMICGMAMPRMMPMMPPVNDSMTASVIN